MEKMIFDTHAHYDSQKFDDDRDEVLNSLPDSGVFAVLNNGTDVESSRRTVELAKIYPFMYAAVGMHPEAAAYIDGAQLDKYIFDIAGLLNRDKVIAIGETGLDYHWELPYELQHEMFKRQLTLSKETGMPIVIHDREAHGDTLEYIKKYEPKGQLHCYSGSVEMMREVLRYGDMMISLGGVVTYKNARVSVEVAREIPIDRLMLETDAPYLTPEPKRGKRNNSGLIIHVAERIAEIRGMSTEDILKYTKENSCRFFGIDE